MSASVPRAVVVTRPTEYEELLARHATRGQARFFLEQRGQTIEEVSARHEAFFAALKIVRGAVPEQWRRTSVARRELDRFLFEPQDIVVVLGQDGLVANVAKYLDGQLVIGLNPDRSRNVGILVPHAPEATSDLLSMAARGTCTVEERSMVCATLDDRQSLVAVNEIFIGHRTHQSARYHIEVGGQTERQSSSGLIVTTGTGATGWAKSINGQRAVSLDLPKPTDNRLAFFVREAFPSVASGVELVQGILAEGDSLGVVSRMDDDGVIFGDGIESDHLRFGWGRRVDIALAPKRLRLVSW